jgi:hypothetical protein
MKGRNEGQECLCQSTYSMYILCSTHVCYTHFFENHKLSKFGRGGPGARGLRLEEPLQLGRKSGAPPKPGVGAWELTKRRSQAMEKRWETMVRYTYKMIHITNALYIYGPKFQCVYLNLACSSKWLVGSKVFGAW